jgi:hypothetical protein
VTEAKAILRSSLAADPNDARAGHDMVALLDNEAECYEDRAKGLFTGEPASPSADAAHALEALTEARSLTEHVLRTEPDSINWRSELGMLLVRTSLQQRALHRTQGTLELAAKGVAMLKAVANQPGTQGFDLIEVATGLTTVLPEQLRDPHLAVTCAERAVEMSHRRKPGFLLTLAHTYHAAGQPEKARAAAQEGLALLPAVTPTTVPSRIRKQLQAEAGK